VTFFKRRVFKQAGSSSGALALVDVAQCKPVWWVLLTQLCMCYSSPNLLIFLRGPDAAAALWIADTHFCAPAGLGAVELTA
jgi:hypothetical protein